MDLLLLLLSPRGRIARMRFLLGNLVLAAGLGLFGLLAWALLLRPAMSGSGPPSALLLPLSVSLVPAMLVGLWSGLALVIKRLHDIGLSGWHAAWIALAGALPGSLDPGTAPGWLLLLANAVSLLAWAWLFAWPGMTGPNRYDEPGPAAAPPRLPWRQPPP